ncbi:MAG: hypothetical protein AABY33_08225 [Pseudomonadota bacterium]
MASRFSELISKNAESFFFKARDAKIDQKEAIDYLAVLSIKGIVEYGDIKDCSREKFEQLHQFACDVGFTSKSDALDYLSRLVTMRGVRRDNLSKADMEYLNQVSESPEEYGLEIYKYTEVSEPTKKDIRNFLLSSHDKDNAGKSPISQEDYDKLEQHLIEVNKVRLVHKAASNVRYYMNVGSRNDIAYHKMDEYLAVLAIKGTVDIGDLKDSGNPKSDCSTRLFKSLDDCASSIGFITKTGYFSSKKTITPGTQEALKQYFTGDKLIETISESVDKRLLETLERVEDRLKRNQQRGIQ